MVRVRSQCKRKRENPSCWQWQCRRTQSLQEGTENEEGNGSEGCDSERENSLGPSVENEEEGWDEVGKRRRTRMRRGENEGDPEGNVVEGDRGG